MVMMSYASETVTVIGLGAQDLLRVDEFPGVWVGGSSHGPFAPSNSHGRRHSQGLRCKICISLAPKRTIPFVEDLAITFPVLHVDPVPP
jgi:hypothetical protein